MTGYRSGFVCAPAGHRRRAARVPALDSAPRRRSSSSARRSPRGRTRSTSPPCATSTGASARRSCRCSSGRAAARPGGDATLLPLARGRRPVGGVRAARCSSTASSSPRARSSARPARATFGSRSYRPRRSASAPPRSSRKCCDVPKRRSRRSTAARSASPSPTATTGSCNEDVQAAILDYFRSRQMEPREVGPFEYHDKIPLKTRLRGARRARRAAGGRALRVVPLAVASS